MNDSLDIRAFRALASRINEDIATESRNFGAGGWIIRDDVAATGMAAVLIQAKIAGMQTCLKHMDQVHKSMTGPIEKKDRKD